MVGHFDDIDYDPSLYDILQMPPIHTDFINANRSRQANSYNSLPYPPSENEIQDSLYNLSKHLSFNNMSSSNNNNDSTNSNSNNLSDEVSIANSAESLSPLFAEIDFSPIEFIDVNCSSSPPSAEALLSSDFTDDFFNFGVESTVNSSQFALKNYVSQDSGLQPPSPLFSSQELPSVSSSQFSRSPPRSGFPSSNSSNILQEGNNINTLFNISASSSTSSSGFPLSSRSNIVQEGNNTSTVATNNESSKISYNLSSPSFLSPSSPLSSSPPVSLPSEPSVSSSTTSRTNILTPPYSPPWNSVDSELDHLVEICPEILNATFWEKSNVNTISEYLRSNQFNENISIENNRLPSSDNSTLPPDWDNLFPNLVDEEMDNFPDTPSSEGIVSSSEENDTDASSPPSSPPITIKLEDTLSYAQLKEAELEKNRLNILFDHSYCARPESEDLSDRAICSPESSPEKVVQRDILSERYSNRKPLRITQEKHCTLVQSRNISFRREGKSLILSQGNQSTAQVKLQLQNAIKDKNKKPRGRVGRPPKVEKAFEVNAQNLDPLGISYTRKIKYEHNHPVAEKKITERVSCQSKKRRTTASDPNDDLERRANHNIMERSRRNSMKQHFQILRELVPEIRDNRKASKALILNKSREYIFQMQELERQQNMQSERLTKYNLALRRKFESLKNRANSYK